MAKINELKDKPCADCGRRFPPECMDFDHVGSKSFQISKARSRRTEAVVAEIAKCDVVCANCHRTRTRTRMLERNAIRGIEPYFSP